MSEIETRLQQVATVITQLDDPKVPRNIRKGARDSIELWLLNTSKQMDVRIAMTQSRLEELFADPNIPPEFQPLIMMINAELEKMLQQL
ncbi:MAG: UPF0147 family protein [Candidatus Thermoplasmatota archaeon]|nr:hypothetical protein [Euryarchaeota archaeon]MEE3134470.1 UPF0147 family protein [Candidatus Thermoplasmatota archaeon]CAI8252380.1 MAG: Uncharacterised protein [Euryarchaeota archaeon]|tara:strand:+ start:284 stop:550 length:267 start_codon:yes stop_codon:yes gene_type:complete